MNVNKREKIAPICKLNTQLAIGLLFDRLLLDIYVINMNELRMLHSFFTLVYDYKIVE